MRSQPEDSFQAQHQQAVHSEPWFSLWSFPYVLLLAQSLVDEMRTWRMAKNLKCRKLYRHPYAAYTELKIITSLQLWWEKGSFSLLHLQPMKERNNSSPQDVEALQTVIGFKKMIRSFPTTKWNVLIASSHEGMSSLRIPAGSLFDWVNASLPWDTATAYSKNIPCLLQVSSFNACAHQDDIRMQEADEYTYFLGAGPQPHQVGCRMQAEDWLVYS